MPHLRKVQPEQSFWGLVSLITVQQHNHSRRLIWGKLNTADTQKRQKSFPGSTYLHRHGAMKPPLDSILCWPRPLWGNWTNGTTFCFNCSDITLQQPAPNNNLTGKLFVPLTASLLCPELCRKLKTAVVFIAVHHIEVYCWTETDEKPLWPAPSSWAPPNGTL